MFLGFIRWAGAMVGHQKDGGTNRKVIFRSNKETRSHKGSRCHVAWIWANYGMCWSQKSDWNGSKSRFIKLMSFDSALDGIICSCFKTVAFSWVLNNWNCMKRPVNCKIQYVLYGFTKLHVTRKDSDQCRPGIWTVWSVFAVWWSFGSLLVQSIHSRLSRLCGWLDTQTDLSPRRVHTLCFWTPIHCYLYSFSPQNLWLVQSREL